MTPLMHAAYRGNLHVCRKLLEHKADVNWNSHKDGVLCIAMLKGMWQYIRAKFSKNGTQLHFSLCPYWFILSLVTFLNLAHIYRHTPFKSHLQWILLSLLSLYIYPPFFPLFQYTALMFATIAGKYFAIYHKYMYNIYIIFTHL